MSPFNSRRRQLHVYTFHGFPFILILNMLRYTELFMSIENGKNAYNSGIGRCKTISKSRVYICPRSFYMFAFPLYRGIPLPFGYVETSIPHHGNCEVHYNTN